MQAPIPWERRETTLDAGTLPFFFRPAYDPVTID